MKQFQQMVGKTIKSVDESRINCVEIEFEDGEKFTVWAECGTADFSIPFFMVEPVIESK